MSPKPIAGWALATTAATLAAWWYQNRTRQDALTEATRTRLRNWGHR